MGRFPSRGVTLSTASPPCYFVSTFVPVAVAYKDGLHTQSQGVTAMSIAPLSARLFRFLPVVASAAFILLMLGTGNHADQTTPIALYPAVSSKSLRNHLSQPPDNIRLAQNTTSECTACVATRMRICAVAERTDHQEIPPTDEHTPSRDKNCQTRSETFCRNHGYCK
jgi:hypothetical protein